MPVSASRSIGDLDLHLFGEGTHRRFAALRALPGWQWSTPGAPLVFMGTELASWQEWNDAADLPWHLLEHPPHRGVHEVLIRLNRLHHDFSSLWRRDDDPAGFQWLAADDREHSIYAFLRWGEHGASVVACIGNFTPVPRAGYRVGLPWTGTLRVVLDTDSPEFWGSGHRSSRGAAGDIDEGKPITATVGEAWQQQPASAVLDIGPMSMVWLTANRPASADG